MTKSELIDRLAEQTGLAKSRVETLIGTILESMVEAMARGEGIEIRGFGSFNVRQYRAYEGRNPRSGETVHVPPKRMPVFKMGKEVRERINGKRSAVSSSPAPTVDAPTERPAPRPKPATARARDEGLSEDAI